MKNFERLMNFFTGRGIFILITSIILLVVAIMHCSSWSDVQEFIPFALARSFCWICNTYCTINGMYQLPVLGNMAI